MTLADRLDAALRATAPDLIGGDEPLADDAAAPVQAAVLVAVTDRAAPGVILTRRTDTLRRHAGQVAFPGGRIDPGEDAVAAALREAAEEVAVPPDAVAVIGATDPYVTATGFRVVPVVGVVPPDLPLVPAEAEVAAVFEVPLAFLLDPANHRRGHLDWQGRRRTFWEIKWQDQRIWGATAGMIVNLARRLT